MNKTQALINCFSELINISGLMAGLSIGAIVGLVILKDTRKRVFASLITSFFAAICFLYTTFISYIIILLGNGLTIRDIHQFPEELQFFVQWIMFSFTIGFLVFCVSICLWGWIHSNTVGIISTFGGVVCITLSIIGFEHVTSVIKKIVEQSG
jgi:hypothetical protein